MLKKLGEHIIKSKTAAGVEITFLPDNGYEINVVVLRREKGAVVSELNSSGIKDFSGLSAVVGLKDPIILVLNGKGIIHKKLAIGENESLTTLLNKVLPNANLADFYLQKHSVGEAHAYVSVVRKSVVDDLLDVLTENKINNIAQCYLGPFVLGNILPVIDKSIISSEFLTLGSHKLLIREDQIHEISVNDTRENKAVKVGEEVLEERSVVAFSAALSFFLGMGEGLLNSEKVDALKNNLREKQKFAFYGWTLLVASFLILIVNYFAFNHYWDKSNDLNSKLALNQSALVRYETLKTEYAQKKGFLEQNGLLENSRTSYFADRVAVSVPQSIQLLDLNIHPMKKKEVSDVSQALYFEGKTIRISGKCEKSTELNDWMKALEENSWVEKIKLLDYKQADAKEDGVFFLELKLK